MMKLMAAKHGWAVEDQAPQFRPGVLASSLPTGPPLVPPTPAYPARGTGLKGRDFHPADGAASSPRQGARLCGPSVVGLVRLGLVLYPRIVRHERGRVVG